MSVGQEDISRVAVDDLKEPYTFFQMLKDVFHPRNVATPTNTAYVLLAITIYFAGYPVEEVKDHLSENVSLVVHAEWMGKIALRNAVITGFVYQTWHYLLYQRDPPMSDKKINPKVPSESQHIRCAMLTFLGSLMASTYEIVFVYCWAKGLITTQDLSAFGLMEVLSTIGYLAVAGYVADIHFFVIHRMMHPWWSTQDTDPGQFLYKHVHYLHHKSVNPGPWSGLAMHPVEHLIYFSRSFWIPFVSAHPLVFLFTNIRAMIGPAPGHHGYEDMYGSVFHIIHHAKYRCNYGTRGFKDRYFGTLDMTPIREAEEAEPEPTTPLTPVIKIPDETKPIRHRLTRKALTALDREKSTLKTAANGARLTVPRLQRSTSTLSLSSTGSRSENRVVKGHRIADL